MSATFEKVVWDNEEELEEFRENMRLIIEYALEIESYCDNKNIRNDKDIIKTYKMNSNLTELSKTKSGFEVLEESRKVLKAFDNLITKIGRDKFVFNDDKTISYKWEWEENK